MPSPENTHHGLSSAVTPPSLPTPSGIDLQRRFSGIARLYGSDSLARLQAAKVAVVGVGGVGSWAAEALARSGVGGLTLIDLDSIAESNVNRQVHALEADFGKAKVVAMAERIGGINPGCVVTAVEDFVTPENVAALLGDHFDYVIDAIDQVRSKAAMIAWCRNRAMPLITAGGAGGHSDPAGIRVADLAATTHDRLLARVRTVLRRDYDFPRHPGAHFGIAAIHAGETLLLPRADQTCAATRPAGGLNCAGLGSSVCVTAVFGMVAASEALHTITGRRPRAGRF